MKSINLMKNVGQFTPSKIAKYNLPQIICMIYPLHPPEIAKCVSVVYELVTLA